MEKVVQKNQKTIITTILILIILAGIFFRFYRITENIFVYYDEGMYLKHNIGFLQYVEKNPPDGIGKLFKYLEIMMHIALSDTKVIWFFIANLRSFFVGIDGNFFVRIMSAIFGSLSLWIAFLFGKRFYASRFAGILSMAMLAILPGHIYYSRLGMQESLSTFCFLAGMHYYFLSEKRNWRTFISSAFFAGVFLSNYRMIIIPAIVFFCEFFLSFVDKRRFDLPKYVWNTVTFFAIIFLIGAIDDGANTRSTFGWIFHQAHLAKGHQSFLNFFSYPYYIFKLESVFFGVLFFGNIYYFFKKEWRRTLPFLIVCLQMIIFSVAQEKGVRYLCSSMPFMAIAVAGLVDYLSRNMKNVKLRRVLSMVVVIMLLNQLWVGWVIAGYKNDYQEAIKYIKSIDRNSRILSTQHMIQKLYVANRDDVMPAPRDVLSLIKMYSMGYKYLIIDPQAYISYTKDKKRFSLPLVGYLGFLIESIKPVAEYEHFNDSLLERFVLEHNEDLPRSLVFLSKNEEKGFGSLKVFKVKECIMAVRYMQKIKAARIEGMK